MTEKVKWDTQKQIDTAWLELDRIAVEEVTSEVIMIVARNNSPFSHKQVWQALEENPGLWYKYSQPGRLLLDNAVAVITEHLAIQLATKFQEKAQQKQMEEIKKQQDKLLLAPAGSFPDEVAAQREKRKR